MTCLTVLQLLKIYDLDEKNIYFTTTELCSYIGGTSANLYPGDELNIHDLLYGLLLPSGNDAAMTLAFNFHKFIINKEKISYIKIRQDMEENNTIENV